MRELLPRTFSTFFGRFPSLTPIQKQGIAAQAGGHDVLLGAPTASGKTEAYAAPAAEALLGGERAPLSVVVISPTRALANDLHRRLAPRMDALGIRFGRHTGEHKERRGGLAAEFAVTTPEAFDSLLARRPALLSTTRVLVLDEIHVLDGTTRGDQLRILLHRLDGVARVRPRRVAASATVNAPEELARRYLDDPRVVLARGRRPIRAKGFAGAGDEAMRGHLDELADAGFKKILVFMNSRAGVEHFTRAQHGRTRFGQRVFAHHGSLSRTRRESVERAFLDAPAAVCAATLTLELGIDIGSVDYVLLADVPPGVDHLLQRLGRGTRRGGDLRGGYVYSSAAQDAAFRFLFQRGAAGELLEDPYAFRPSVVVQQALVCAAAWGDIDAARLAALLPQELRAALGPRFCLGLLESLARRELLEHRGRGLFVPMERVEALYARGRIHGNIDQAPDVPVVDRMTGEVLGHVSYEAVGNASASPLRLGGTDRRIVSISSSRIVTDHGAGGRGMPAETRFAGRGAPPFPFTLARALAHALGAPRDGLVLRRCGPDYALLHGLGSVGSLLLRHLLEGAPRGPRVLEAGPLAMTLSRALSRLPAPSAADLDAFLRERRDRLLKILSMGPWQDALPLPTQRAAMRAVGAMDAIRTFLETARLQAEPDDEAPPDWFL